MFICKLVDHRAEGSEGELRKLEALLAEGDTDDGNAPDKTSEHETESNAESTKDEPDDVSKRMLAKVGVYSLAKGSKGKLCHLESLLAEGDTDDGDAPNDTKEEPSKCRRKTGKEEPKKIADEFHEKFPPFIF